MMTGEEEDDDDKLARHGTLLMLSAVLILYNI